MAVLQAVSLHNKERFRRRALQEPYPMCLLRGSWEGGGNLVENPLVNRQSCGEREDGKRDTEDGGK